MPSVLPIKTAISELRKNATNFSANHDRSTAPDPRQIVNYPALAGLLNCAGGWLNGRKSRNRNTLRDAANIVARRSRAVESKLRLIYQGRGLHLPALRMNFCWTHLGIPGLKQRIANCLHPLSPRQGQFRDSAAHRESGLNQPSKPPCRTVPHRSQFFESRRYSCQQAHLAIDKHRCWKS